MPQFKHGVAKQTLTGREFHRWRGQGCKQYVGTWPRELQKQFHAPAGGCDGCNGEDRLRYTTGI